MSDAQEEQQPQLPPPPAPAPGLGSSSPAEPLHAVGVRAAAEAEADAKGGPRRRRSPGATIALDPALVPYVDSPPRPPPNLNPPDGELDEGGLVRQGSLSASGSNLGVSSAGSSPKHAPSETLPRTHTSLPPDLLLDPKEVIRRGLERRRGSTLQRGDSEVLSSSRRGEAGTVQVKVGSHTFRTTLAILQCRPSLLTKLGPPFWEADPLVLAADPVYFSVVLSYLTHVYNGKDFVVNELDRETVKHVAEQFDLPGLAELCAEPPSYPHHIACHACSHLCSQLLDYRTVRLAAWEDVAIPDTVVGSEELLDEQELERRKELNAEEVAMLKRSTELFVERKEYTYRWLAQDMIAKQRIITQDVVAAWQCETVQKWIQWVQERVGRVVTVKELSRIAGETVHPNEMHYTVTLSEESSTQLAAVISLYTPYGAAVPFGKIIYEAVGHIKAK